MDLLRVFHGLGLTDDVNLDLSGVGELLFDLFGYIPGQKDAKGRSFCFRLLVCSFASQARYSIVRPQPVRRLIWEMPAPSLRMARIRRSLDERPSVWNAAMDQMPRSIT